MMRGFFPPIMLCLLALLAGSSCSPQPFWSDEFNGSAGAPPDQTKWVYDLGASGWGNAELQEYTDSRANSFQDGEGHLVIRAQKEADGRYTSARLKTKGKFEVQYGRIEARMRLPRGQGIWPAFWMLGSKLSEVGWPQCGEIDVMENIGKEPAIVHGTIHGPGYSGADAIGGKTTLPGQRPLAEDFHIYAVDWRKEGIRFYLDGGQYFEVKPDNIPAGAEWVFDQPFFLLLNLAVGGHWPGYPDESTAFPQELVVDWIRVYR